MPQLSGTGASLKEYLLKEFDQLIQKRGYPL
jgi:metal-responsive CopG/Arc/MetJ family transcriptional regulator